MLQLGFVPATNLGGHLGTKSFVHGWALEPSNRGSEIGQF